MDYDFAMLTPEKTIVTYRLGSVGSRLFATALDLIMLAGTVLIISMLALAFSLADGALAAWLLFFAFTLYPFVYFVLCEWLWNGQTVGKRALRLRVRMDDGTPITFGGSLGRNLLRPADILVGAVAVFLNPKSQRLGDFVGHTIVVQESASRAIPIVAPHQFGVHPLEDSVGDLRGMTLAEYDTLRRLCDRYPELPGETQRALMHRVWSPFAKRRKVASLDNVHDLYLAEAVVMKYGRKHGLL